MHQSILALPFLLALGVHSVRAQQPTSEQRDAIRAACCSDFIANCAGVEPGAKEALACLMRSHDNLSAPCKTAVDAVATKPEAPAAAAPPPVAPPSQTAAPSPPAEKPAPTTSQDELNAVRGACTPNESIVLDCSSVPKSWFVCGPTAPAYRPPAALRRTVQRLQTLPHPVAHRPQNAREAAPSRAATTAAPGVTSGKPTAAQTAAIRSACRSDFMLLRRSAGRACGLTMLAEQCDEALANMPDCDCGGQRERACRRSSVTNNGRGSGGGPASAARIRSPPKSPYRFADLPR